MDEKSCGAIACRRCASSAPSRVSCQAIRGATGSPRASSSTPASPRLVTPTPPIRPGGQSLNASATADLAASKRAIASSSAPVDVNVHGVAARPDETGSPASVNTTALLVWVPTSRPTKNMSRISLPWLCDLAHLDNDGYSCISLVDCQEARTRCSPDVSQ